MIAALHSKNVPPGNTSSFRCMTDCPSRLSQHNLPNVGHRSPKDTVSYCRRLASSASSLWETQISQSDVLTTETHTFLQGLSFLKPINSILSFFRKKQTNKQGNKERQKQTNKQSMIVRYTYSAVCVCVCVCVFVIMRERMSTSQLHKQSI